LGRTLADEADNPTTIIVAEDDRLLRLIAVEFLTDAGFSVIEATHAKDAMGVLEVQFEEIHILFTDIHMPGEMDGLALAHHVKRNWPQISLLITSGDLLPDQKDLPEGSKFLRKPYHHDHVINHVRSLRAA
jgi:CheY-like chemotaxis protein